MKPKNNRVMCPECFRQKMLFETQKQADNFIKWNGEDIDTNGGELRSYYCPACGGYHISSKPYRKVYEHNTENLIKRYEKDILLTERAKKVELPDLSQYTKDILEHLPSEVNSKTKLKKHLSEYFLSNGINNVTLQQEIRTEIYKLIKSGKYVMRTQTVCDNSLSDEEVLELIKDKKIEDTIQLGREINILRTKHNLVISKSQFKRITELWYKYNFEKNNN